MTIEACRGRGTAGSSRLYASRRTRYPVPTFFAPLSRHPATHAGSRTAFGDQTPAPGGGARPRRLPDQSHDISRAPGAGSSQRGDQRNDWTRSAPQHSTDRGVHPEEPRARSRTARSRTPPRQTRGQSHDIELRRGTPQRSIAGTDRDGTALRTALRRPIETDTSQNQHSWVAHHARRILLSHRKHPRSLLPEPT